MSITQPGLPEPQYCLACHVPMEEKAAADGTKYYFCRPCGGFVHVVPQPSGEPLVSFVPPHLAVEGSTP